MPPPVHPAGTDTLKLGLIGCGRRGGSAVLQALKADEHAVLHAMADVFADRQKLSLASLTKQRPDQIRTGDRLFLGFDAYQKVVDSGVDAVILTTPPGFRPQHLHYAVSKGKHAFCEKAMAVDAPGYRSLLESSRIAREKNLTIVAGLTSRYSNPEIAVFERIKAGAIGQIQVMHSWYYTGSVWLRPREAGWSDVEWQIRNWPYFTWLSGDFIVEQADHTIDKLAWAMDEQMPEKATGVGGRQVRTGLGSGHTFDHFAIVYEWKNGVRAFLNCRQQDACYADLSDHFIGSDGSAHLSGYGPIASIRSKNPWTYEGDHNNVYLFEQQAFVASIRGGAHRDDSLRMANSTMMSILGRMAAYTGQCITWDQAVASKEDLFPQNLELGPLPVAPVAMPGKRRFW